jgi:hypothetical protein
MALHIIGGVLAVMAFVAFAWKIKRDAAEVDPVNDMRTVRRVRMGNILDDDLVRIVGRVVPRHAPLTAPISGRRCVAFVVEVYLPDDRSPFITNNDSAAFFLDGDGARALVLPPFPVLALSSRVRVQGRPDELPAEMRAWLEENRSSDDWKEAEALRCIERRIEPGETITLVGLARRGGSDGEDGAVGYREMPTTIVFETADGAPLSLSDDASLLKSA